MGRLTQKTKKGKEKNGGRVLNRQLWPTCFPGRRDIPHFLLCPFSDLYHPSV